jgi:hypothetical protein
MGDADEDETSLSERRRFLERLRADEDVVAVDFTRDGYRTVFVEVVPDDGLDEGLRREAERIGYAVESRGADGWRQWRLPEWWEGSPEDVRVLRLDPDRKPFRRGPSGGSDGQ